MRTIRPSTMIGGVVLFVLAQFFLVACVRSRGIEYEPRARQATPLAFPIQIYDSSDVPRPFKVIGIVKVRASKIRSAEAIIAKLKEEARKMGGAALLDLAWGEGDGAIVDLGNGVYSRGHKELITAKVIVFPGP